jgi:hypothetical protein
MERISRPLAGCVALLAGLLVTTLAVDAENGPKVVTGVFCDTQETN